MIDDLTRARRKHGICEPPPDSEWRVWGQIAAQMVADEEWHAAMRRNVPMLARALMRCGSERMLRIDEIIQDQTERQAVAYQVLKWQNGGHHPEWWDPSKDTADVSSRILGEWLAFWMENGRLR